MVRPCTFNRVKHATVSLHIHTFIDEWTWKAAIFSFFIRGKRVTTTKSRHVMAPFIDSPVFVPFILAIHTLIIATGWWREAVSQCSSRGKRISRTQACVVINGLCLIVIHSAQLFINLSPKTRKNSIRKSIFDSAEAKTKTIYIVMSLIDSFLHFLVFLFLFIFVTRAHSASSLSCGVGGRPKPVWDAVVYYFFCQLLQWKMTLGLPVVSRSARLVLFKLCAVAVS